jgi:RNA recognition motif-containing protein
MNIYVGNISWDSTEEEIKNTFAAHGAVSSVKIITDKFTGRSRGFGFVEMPEKTEAESAISTLNGPKKEGSRGAPRGNRSSRGNQSRW